MLNQVVLDNPSYESARAFKVAIITAVISSEGIQHGFYGPFSFTIIKSWLLLRLMKGSRNELHLHCR
jgi:hypothetical protein